MAPNDPTDQSNPVEQIQAGDRAIQETINTHLVNEATKPRSEKGRECRDMIGILKNHGFTEHEIKDAVVSFWGLGMIISG